MAKFIALAVVMAALAGCDREANAAQYRTTVTQQNADRIEVCRKNGLEPAIQFHNTIYGENMTVTGCAPTAPRMPQ